MKDKDDFDKFLKQLEDNYITPWWDESLGLWRRDCKPPEDIQDQIPAPVKWLMLNPEMALDYQDKRVLYICYDAARYAGNGFCPDSNPQSPATTEHRIWYVKARAYVLSHLHPASKYSIMDRMYRELCFFKTNSIKS